MRIDTDGERFGFETEPRDAELARATASLVSDAKALAEAAGVLGTAECEGCGKTARLRPYPFYNDGNFLIGNICPQCQRQKTEEARAKYQSDAAETPPSERGGE